MSSEYFKIKLIEILIRLKIQINKCLQKYKQWMI